MMTETAAENMDGEDGGKWADALNKRKSFCKNWSRLKDVAAPSSNDKCYQLAGGSGGSSGWQTGGTSCSAGYRYTKY